MASWRETSSNSGIVWLPFFQLYEHYTHPARHGRKKMAWELGTVPHGPLCKQALRPCCYARPRQAGNCTPRIVGTPSSRLTVVELKRGNTATTAGAGFALRLLLAQMPPVPRSSTNRWWRYGKYPFYPQKHLPQSLPETSLLSERWNTERRAALHHGGLPTAPPCRCRNRIAERPATGRRSRRTSHS